MTSPLKKRLHFLDGLRAFAILLMLEGHFIDTLLAPEFRDPDNVIYSVWLYMRGITAPVFFTITGTVFAYLLIRWEGKVRENPRLLKGLRRGGYLILLGYLLRLDIFSFWTLISSLKIPRYFLVVDVLHCIGLSIIGIVGLYVLAYGRIRFLFQVLALALGLGIFLFERNYFDLTLEAWPLFLRNYMVRENSVFTILPWIGYAFLGAYLGTVLQWLGTKKGEYTLQVMAGIMGVIGWWLMERSSAFLMRLFYWTDVQIFHKSAYFNYLFHRMGDVLVIFAIFMLLESVLKKMTLFLEMGRSTLTIYIFHFIVLFGSWFGISLDQFFYKKLGPESAIAGAVVFVLGICVMTYGWNRREKILDRIK